MLKNMIYWHENAYNMMGRETTTVHKQKYAFFFSRILNSFSFMMMVVVVVVAGILFGCLFHL